jgi:DNA-binding helix-hairpin-helix protein with protein kinase domain
MLQTINVSIPTDVQRDQKHGIDIQIRELIIETTPNKFRLLKICVSNLFEIGIGAEASVYTLPNTLHEYNTPCVVKIWNEVTPTKLSKLEILLQLSQVDSATKYMILPLGRVYDSSSRSVIGYIMPNISVGHSPLSEVLSKAGLNNKLKWIKDFKFLLIAVHNFLHKVTKQPFNIVVGDFNPANFYVTTVLILK